MRTDTFLSIAKQFFIFFILLTVVLVTNQSIISFNLMYPEQPSIYLVNQRIHHFSDLLNIYLHPILLNQNIPFFRPSGHFLIYQLITPFLGWHNTKAFFIINFIFLALIGYLFIALYKILFPRYHIGAYVAFSLYLMHPALSLARLTIMHFEFAYVFFLMLSLYLFIIFCKNNINNINTTHRYQNLFLLFLSFFIYVLAVTFKEPALMLGPVLFCYFCIFSYEKNSFKLHCHHMLKNKESLLIMLGIISVSVLLGFYIISSWPNIHYPTTILNPDRTWGAINAFAKDVLGLQRNVIDGGYLAFPDLVWRTIIFPYSVRLMIWLFLFLLISCSLFLLIKQSTFITWIYQKSFLFLLVSSLLFLILPFAWAMGGPWHYTLTLVTLTLMMGFSLEFIHEVFSIRKFWLHSLSIIIIIFNIILTIDVNHQNVKKYNHVEKGRLGLAVNRNAILNPPNIKSQLTPTSLVVVEDSILHNDYLMGNAAYPFLLFLGNNDFDKIQYLQRRFFFKFQPIYSGSFFRYAYLMPSLKEELYPFNVSNMKDIPNEIIYHWLKQYNNIFCLGYDDQGNWHNKTIFFKQQLLKEKKERDLNVHAYDSLSVAFKSKTMMYSESLSYPDAQLCQFRCDQDQTCRGLIYEYFTDHHVSHMQCFYIKDDYLSGKEKCMDCKWYKKGSSLDISLNP